MITTILAAMALTGAHEVIDMNPIDDAWVYPHASDPQSDGFLRVWGQAGAAVPADMNDRDNYSFSYLRFDIERCPTDKKLEAAELILTHNANPGYSLEAAKKSPIQVRALIGTFTEKAWSYELGMKIVPSAKKEDVFGEAAPTEIPADRPFTVSIDLFKKESKFADYLAKGIASKDKTLCLALTSMIDPSEGGQSSIYKFYSKDNKDDAKVRPVLRLTFEGDTVQIPLATRL
ncbi:MAG: hypothetical protein KF784_14550 [Fimbriimonadaceae bacterium]|nr:hypothetical protein [Fimbriimonadaceae bacterium]